MPPLHPSGLAPSTRESHCPARRPPGLRCILLLFPEALFAVSSAQLLSPDTTVLLWARPP